MMHATEYEETVSSERVANTLSYFAMCKAKYLVSSGQDLHNTNPWLASLLLYVTVGDDYTRRDTSTAKTHLAVAIQGGWAVQDILQVIEWSKDAMPMYPTSSQWSEIFQVSESTITQIQQQLVPTMFDVLTDDEQHAWSMVQALGLSFRQWEAQLGPSNVGSTNLELPNLEP